MTKPFALLLVLAVAALQGGQPATETTTAAVAVSVNRVAFKAGKKGAEQDVGGFHDQTGVKLAVLLNLAGGGIIALDHNACVLRSFVDDKGTDLTRNPGDRFLTRPGFGMLPKISDDGTACVFEVRSSILPAAGAQQLTASGDVALRVATQKKPVRLESVIFKAGTELKGGGYVLTIDKTGKPEWGGKDFPFAVTFKASQSLSAIESVEFLDAAGKPVESQRGSYSRFGMNNTVTETVEYQLKKPLDAGSVILYVWTDLSEKKIPFTVTTGLGLP